MFPACAQSIFIRLSISTCTGISVYVFGPDSIFYEVVCILAALDIVTGIMVGYKNKEISSKAFFKKAPTLVVYLALLVSAYHLSRLWPDSWLSGIQGFVAGYIAVGEFISITENAGYLGVPLPKALLGALKDVKDFKNFKPKK